MKFILVLFMFAFAGPILVGGVLIDPAGARQAAAWALMLGGVGGLSLALRARRGSTAMARTTRRRPAQPVPASPRARRRPFR